MTSGRHCGRLVPAALKWEEAESAQNHHEDEDHHHHEDNHDTDHKNHHDHGE